MSSAMSGPVGSADEGNVSQFRQNAIATSFDARIRACLRSWSPRHVCRGECKRQGSRRANNPLARPRRHWPT